ncbi:MAG: UDP-N-acetylglucosamine--N-acetylmuramyl-(pentapeptide) pyrophosphoryl-undecaprenol N-acetylglucosamine transferase [Candidatus Saccharimonadales bacterium]
MSLARELKSQKPDCQIIYIGHKGDLFDSFKESGHDFDFTAFIRAGKFRRYHNVKFAKGIFDLKTMALNIRDFLRLPGSVLASVRILRKFKPDVVFSKGGFVAVPVGIAARLLGIPIVTHDSDSLPGLANRFIGRWARANATGMPAEYYPYPRATVHYVGIPIDERIKKVTPRLQNEVKRKLKLPPGSRVLLVSGGGNGSKRLNDLMLSIAAELLETNLSLYIIHLTGSSHEQDVKAAYKSLPKNDQKRLIVMGYSNDFYVLAAAADVVVSRAGATTLAELAAAGKACIVIPSPFLVGGHQLKNAEQLAEQDAVVVAPEEVRADELLALISSLLGNDQRRFELARNLYATAKPEASQDLAKLILKIAKR